MSTTEVIDTIRKAMEKQDWRQSYSRTDTQCLYRGPDNCVCAVGALITDEQYDSEMEGTGSCGLHNFGIDLGSHDDMLVDFQAWHDKDQDSKELRIREFEALADRAE